MEKRRIGNLEVSLLGVGTNSFGTSYFGARCDQDQVTATVRAALDVGVNFFDTAEMYGDGASEQMLGIALGARRDEAIIATKFGQMPHDPNRRRATTETITAALESSLRRLGTDRIDLYLQHYPDPETPIDVTLQALDDLRTAGKIREFGCTNYSANALSDARLAADQLGVASFATVQNPLNVMVAATQREVLDVCQADRVAFIAHTPLAGGMLTGKYRRGEQPDPDSRMAGFPESVRARMFADDTFDVIAKLDSYAQQRGHSLVELAMGWLRAQPALASFIAGATRPNQIEANVSSAQAWVLTEGEIGEVLAVLTTGEST